MSAKNALKGYGYQVNVLNAFVQKMDLKRNIKKIESEAEVEHNFDDIVITDENENTLCFQVKTYEININPATPKKFSNKKVFSIIFKYKNKLSSIFIKTI